MNKKEANQTSPPYELKVELARLCLPMASCDANFKLAWVNLACIVFVLIGITATGTGRPVVVEPIKLLLQETLFSTSSTSPTPLSTTRTTWCRFPERGCIGHFN